MRFVVSLLGGMRERPSVADYVLLAIVGLVVAWPLDDLQRTLVVDVRHDEAIHQGALQSSMDACQRLAALPQHPKSAAFWRGMERLWRERLTSAEASEQVQL